MVEHSKFQSTQFSLRLRADKSPCTYPLLDRVESAQHENDVEEYENCVDEEDAEVAGEGGHDLIVVAPRGDGVEVRLGRLGPDSIEHF